ncbi:hypothetical protein AALO_G00228330 [Alosa alosa]|uniref:Uncharacterized protein n=1 Tax=Alosa alosa TaxID=278164 RepID=A0AAV6G5U2_9TELE|nr:hypothetical protein AALO_G00228330 [Alosa alosa]
MENHCVVFSVDIVRQAGSESSKAMFSPTHIPDPAQFTAATQDCYSDLHTTLFQSSFRRLTIWHKMIGNKRHPVMSSPELSHLSRPDLPHRIPQSQRFPQVFWTSSLYCCHYTTVL